MDKKKISPINSKFDELKTALELGHELPFYLKLSIHADYKCLHKILTTVLPLLLETL